MTDKSHPGDWLYVMGGDRMIAMTPEAYAAAVRLADDEAPDAWEDLKSRGGTRGQLIKAALDVLAGSGSVRVEVRVIVGGDDLRWPVYSLVPEHEAAELRQQLAEQRQQRAKRTRRKRAPQDGPPAFVLVEGGASG